MDKNEAKLLLQAYRPNGQDAGHPFFAEALACVEADPELKIWWEAQQNFDRKVSAKLQAVPVPDHLRTTLLASHKIEHFAPRFRLPHWLAAAAVVAFLFVVGLHPWSNRLPLAAIPIASHEYNASILHFLNDDPGLGLMASDHAKVVDWLQQRHAPTGSIPLHMTTMPTLGCQKFALHGHDVSLICFSLAGGEVAHLFIVDEKALVDPPGPSPTFAQMDSWSTASWSDGTKSYLLMTEAGPDTLKHLL